jgi:anti-sigma regulatory factor (Ser/Thr protein kinase)
MSSRSWHTSQPIAKLPVPNTLRHGTGGVEILFKLVEELPLARRYIFDMGGVTFIEPCGVIALLSVIRHCAERSGNRVLINNLNEQLYPYLHRMDLFRVAETWLRPLTPLNEEWSRNAHSINLLELTPVTDYDDMTAVIERARSIFTPWLSSDEISNLLLVISELCQNIYEHSGDKHGCVIIQKYQPEQSRVFICMSVGDSGRGIRANLIKRYRGLGTEPLDFVRAAMDGKHTSRPHGRGGLGLRTVRNITATHNGYVTVRSETAGVTDWGKAGVQSSGNLTNMVGTQVSVKMFASAYS